jgi:hypothetical protein
MKKASDLYSVRQAPVPILGAPWERARAPGGDGDLDDVAERLRFTKGQLADVLGVSPDTLYRADRAAASAKVQGRLMELTSILRRVSDWAGGEQAALAWYLSYPIAAFGGRTAEQLVKDGKAGAVRDWLDQVAVGGFA